MPRSSSSDPLTLPILTMFASYLAWSIAVVQRFGRPEPGWWSVAHLLAMAAAAGTTCWCVRVYRTTKRS